MNTTNAVLGSEAASAHNITTVNASSTLHVIQYVRIV